MTIKDIFTAVSKGQAWMVKNRETGNNTYGQIANQEFAKLSGLIEPRVTDGIGGQIWSDFQGKKMYSEMSYKQAWCIAFAFAKLNGINN